MFARRRPLRVARQIGERHRGHRRSEQTDGQNLEQLGVPETRRAALARQRAKQRVYQPRELRHPRPQHHRSPREQHIADALGFDAPAHGQAVQHAPARGQLDPDLKDGARHRAPREGQAEPGQQDRRGQIGRDQPGGRHDEAGDPRDVPDGRGRIRQEETAVRVQNPETPGRNDHEARHREEQARERHRERARFAGEPGTEDGRERRRERDPDQRQRAGGEQQQPENRAGESAAGPLVALVERSINGNERRGQRAFAQQVADCVGESLADAQGVRRPAVSDVMGYRALADIPEHAGEEDAGRHPRGAAAATTGQDVGFLRRGSSSRRCMNCSSSRIPATERFSSSISASMFSTLR